MSSTVSSFHKSRGFKRSQILANSQCLLIMSAGFHIKLFSINFEFEPELVLSRGLGLIQCVDMVRDGSSLSLTILIHRKQKSSLQKAIEIENRHRRGFFRSIRMRPAINKDFRSQILWLIIPFRWVQPEIWRSYGSTSNRRSGNNLLGFISEDLPSRLVIFVVGKTNPMSSFLIGLCRKLVIRFIFIKIVVNRFWKRKCRS